MIWIEKSELPDNSYKLCIGDSQQYKMWYEDLLDLKKCFDETLGQGEEATPDSEFRLLNSFQYEDYFTDGRCTLWVGLRKWHIREHEEELLWENLADLLESG